MAKIYINSNIQGDMSIFSKYRFQHEPIQFYRILNLSTGEYLDDYTFVSEQAAHEYLEKHIHKQWETYMDVKRKAMIYNIQYSPNYSTSTSSTIYCGGKEYKQPTDREYMFDIVKAEK